ncbi:hypothetical protein JW960_07555 [candidate division KSB1 bacterium]|nr:hypothetical protein [candidate division KSB1 bacterium]
MNKSRENSIAWFKYFVELFVVFIGVTAAFLLNKWGEKSLERQRMQHYMTSFADDIHADIIQLTQLIKDDEEKLNRISGMMHSIKSATVSVDSATTLIKLCLENQFFTPQQITYEIITSSSDLRILQNYVLKERLVKYYLKIDDTNIKQNLFIEHLNDYIIPYAVEQMDLANQKFINQHAMNGVLFRNLITGYFALLQQNVDVYKEALNQANQLIEILPPIEN